MATDPTSTVLKDAPVKVFLKESVGSTARSQLSAMSRGAPVKGDFKERITSTAKSKMVVWSKIAQTLWSMEWCAVRAVWEQWEQSKVFHNNSKHQLQRLVIALDLRAFSTFNYTWYLNLCYKWTTFINHNAPLEREQIRNWCISRNNCQPHAL